MGEIGFIDIGSEPKLYILEKKNGNFRLIKTQHLTCTKGCDISISDIPSGIDEFCLSLPLSDLNFRLMELPFSDKEKILNVLPYELASFLLNGADSVIADGIVHANKDGKSSVLAVYMEKAVMSNIIERLRACNIEPRIVTSIELSHVMKEFCPARLMKPVDISSEERISTVIREVKDSTINLRKGEFSYAGDADRLRKALRLSAALIAAALILFVLSAASRMVSVKRESAAIQDEVKKIYSEVFPSALGDSQGRNDKNAEGGLYQIKSQIKELKKKGTLLIGISPLNLLLNLANSSSGGSVVFNEISMDRARVTLRCEAAAFSDIQQMKDALSKILNEVNISDSKTSAQGRVLFTVTAMEKKD